MPNGMRWVGLDVHAHASTLALFDDVTGGDHAPGGRPAAGGAGCRAPAAAAGAGGL
jgi:hypothetical protein